MPLFTAARTGICCLVPGDSMNLFDGTETPSDELASIMFARGYSPSGDDAGSTFTGKGLASDLVIDIEAANPLQGVNPVDGDFSQVGQISAGSLTYTDIGRSAFYRAKITTYTSGSMPTVTVQR